MHLKLIDIGVQNRSSQGLTPLSPDYKDSVPPLFLQVEGIILSCTESKNKASHALVYFIVGFEHNIIKFSVCN